jgi:hypothetical protein
MRAVDSPEIQKEDVYLGTGFNKEAEDNIKWALDKYWTFGTKIKLIDNTQDAFKIDKNISYISLLKYEGDFSSTELTVSNNMAGWNRFKIFSLSFDDMIKKGKDTKVIGADKDIKLVAYKCLTYTMLFCSIVKNFSIEMGNTFKFARAYTDKLEKLKEKLKTTTILIPKELIDNGITEEAIKGLNIKYKIETSEQIATRIKDGKDIKNYSHLIVFKESNTTDWAYLVDLETGDLINYCYLESGTFTKTYKYMDDKRFAELLEKLEK